MLITEQMKEQNVVPVGGGALTIEQVVQVARFNAKVELQEESIRKMAKSRAYVEKRLARKKWCTA
ncbi:aromatic amino acid ammonia-lyase [Paenibacillus sp. P25]|nr:aromatic amino acid ammonia-lyase [Paenibacillus sp. P25]